MADFILAEAQERKADGVDFVSIFTNPYNIQPKDIYESWTMEDIIKRNAYPKSGRLYWRIIDSKKVYLDSQGNPIETDSIEAAIVLKFNFRVNLKKEATVEEIHKAILSYAQSYCLTTNDYDILDIEYVYDNEK